MPKTSDYCSRCESVQVGLRRADGRFLCLNCSTKQEVAEAAAVPVRVHRQEDLRSSKSLGATALVLGLLVAVSAVPVTLYCRAAGDASTALLVIIPAALAPLFVGLLSSRNRMGLAGAILSVLACVQVLFMVLIMESRKAEGRARVGIDGPGGSATDRERPPTVTPYRGATPDPEPVARLPEELPKPVAVPRGEVMLPSPPIKGTERDVSLEALRARADDERQRLHDLQRLQELTNTYYAAAREAELLQSQRELLEAKRARLKGQIESCDLRIRQAEAEAKAAQKKEESSDQRLRNVIYGVRRPDNPFVETDQLALERNGYQVQLNQIDGELIQLAGRIAGAKAKATVVGKALVEHCERIGEPAPKLREFAEPPGKEETPPAPAGDAVAPDADGPGTGPEPTAPATDASSTPPAEADRTGAAAGTREAPAAKRKTYVLRDGRSIQAQHVIEMGEELAIRDEDGEVHRIKKSDVREVLR